MAAVKREADGDPAAVAAAPPAKARRPRTPKVQPAVKAEGAAVTIKTEPDDDDASAAAPGPAADPPKAEPSDPLDDNDLDAWDAAVFEQLDAAAAAATAAAPPPPPLAGPVVMVNRAPVLILYVQRLTTHPRGRR